MNKFFSKFNGIRILLFISSFFFANAPTYAGVDADLNSFFDSLGFSGFNSNVTPSMASKGQEAGYYTGGSLFARTPVRNLQLTSLDLPSYRSGCGGIDLFAGGFSFINSDQLVTLMKNIMNNSKGYAFTLALESATPLLANVIKDLRTAAAHVNAINVNSCETAVGLVGSAWPRTQEAQRRVCADIGSQQGIFGDYASAKQSCGSEGRLTETLNRGGSAKNNMVFKEGNLAWNAIQQNAFLKSDQQLAELFMSLSGTIIIKPNARVLDVHNGETADNQDHKLDPSKPSLATDMKLIGALLNGGKAKIYKCTEPTKCLDVGDSEITISPQNALKNRVGKELQKMAEKFVNDTRISDSEIGLMQATTLPIQKMLNVQTAFYKDYSVLDISSYTDIIAIDILFQYLNENLNIVRASAANLQISEAFVSKFIDGIDMARRNLRNLQKSAYAEINTTNSIIKQTKMIEEMLSSSYSEHMNLTMKWSRGEL